MRVSLHTDVCERPERSELGRPRATLMGGNSFPCKAMWSGMEEGVQEERTAFGHGIGERSQGHSGPGMWKRNIHVRAGDGRTDPFKPT